MKKISIIVLSLVILVGMTTGCTSEDLTAEEFINNCIEQNSEITSMAFDGDIEVSLNTEEFNFEIIDETMSEKAEEINNENESADDVIVLETEETNDELINLIKTVNTFDINYSGKTSSEPLQLEMDMNIATAIQGMNLTLSAPVKVEGETMYVKVPTLLASFMPDPTIEYLSVDLTHEEKAVDETVEDEAFNLICDLVNNVDDTVFNYEDADLYEIDDVKTSKVVSINITQENIQPVVDYLYNTYLPEVITFMEQNTNDQEQVQQFKDQLESNRAEIEQSLINISQSVQVNSGKVTAVYDKDNFLRKIIIDVDVVLSDKEYGNLGIIVSGEKNISSINEELNFEKDIPAPEKTMTFEQLMELNEIDMDME